jgi:hypothetical protein
MKYKRLYLAFFISHPPHPAHPDNYFSGWAGWGGWEKRYLQPMSGLKAFRLNPYF